MSLNVSLIAGDRARGARPEIRQFWPFPGARPAFRRTLSRRGGRATTPRYAAARRAAANDMHGTRTRRSIRIFKRGNDDDRDISPVPRAPLFHSLGAPSSAPGGSGWGLKPGGSGWGLKSSASSVSVSSVSSASSSWLLLLIGRS